MTDFLKQDRDKFIDWVAKFGPGGRPRPYEYVVTAETYRSETPDSGTQSLVLEIDNDTGLANEGHPNTTFQAFNFDIGKHAPITFHTLFKPRTKPLEVLNPIVQRELDARAAELNVEDVPKLRDNRRRGDLLLRPKPSGAGQQRTTPSHSAPHRTRIATGLIQESATAFA